MNTPSVLVVGRPPVLTATQEAEIVETCQIFSEWGFGLTKSDIVNVIGDYFRHTKHPNPFRDGVPGDDWWRLFIKRHPEVFKRKPQTLQMVRAKAATSDIVDHWFFQCLKPVLDDLQLHEKPQCIFNVDESGFPLSGRPAHVICKKKRHKVTTSYNRLIREREHNNSGVSKCSWSAATFVHHIPVYRQALDG